MQHTNPVQDGYHSAPHPSPLGFPGKNLQVFSTRRVLTELGFQETNIILIEMIKTFNDHMYDMFILSPTPSGQVQVRLAGYHFLTNELNEKKIISSLRIEIPETVWFKVDDYHDHYVGTLLFPDEY